MLTPTQREHLEMIRSTTGGVLRPREVLADAKNPNSPLHGLFLWNDAEAASAYRLQQAKDICRVVVRMSASAPREAVRAVVRTGGPAASAPEPKTISDEDRYIATAIAAARAYVQAEEAQRAVCFWATKVADDGPIASTSYAIDAFIRGIPARCIVDVAAGMGSAGDAEWTEDRVAQIVSQYRLSRPVGWIERQASDEWIEDEDFEESTVYGLPLYAPPVVNHFPGQGRDHGGSLRRFEMKPRETIQDKEAASLNADHSALTEARTLFPTRVFDSADADHVLVSGHNNAKIGAFVTKGPWAGMSIYTLTMEERAT